MAYVEGDFPIQVGGSNGGAYGNDGFGGWWGIIALIAVAAIFGGNGGFGWGGNGGGNGALTRSDLCQDMNFNNLESAVRGVQNGLCDGFYAVNTGLLNGFAGVQQTLCQGFGGVNTAITTQGYQNQLATQSLSSQLASCCCDIERGLDRIACQQATDTGAIISAGQANTQRILDYLCQEKISSLQAENSLLTAQLSQNSQTNTIINALRPTPVPAFPASNLYGYYGSGCGCQSSCGCNGGYGYGNAF